MEKISATIITYNEENNISRCIKSLSFCDEIVVVDSKSNDKTVEIAKNLGAKVIIQEFLGYGKQKQFAVNCSQNNWILSLDADEYISDELKKAIIGLKNKGFNKDAYSINRISFHLSRWIKHGGWYPDRKIRLFNKKNAHWDTDAIHEKVIVNGEVGYIKGDIKHLVFKDLAHNIDTNNKYSSIMANDLYKNGKKFSIFKLLFKPIGKFLEVYIYKRGFLDGLPGFIIAIGASYSMFLKFAKLWEIENNNKVKC